MSFLIMLLLIRGSSKEQVSPFKIIIFEAILFEEMLLTQYFLKHQDLLCLKEKVIMTTNQKDKQHGSFDCDKQTDFSWHPFFSRNEILEIFLLLLKGGNTIIVVVGVVGVVIVTVRVVIIVNIDNSFFTSRDFLFFSIKTPLLVFLRSKPIPGNVE